MSCAGLLAACGQATPLAPTAAPATVAPVPTPAPTSTAIPTASAEGDLVDNLPPVRNTAEARRYSGQKIAIYALILGDALDDAIARRFTRDTGIQAQIVRTPTGVGTSSTAQFEFFQRFAPGPVTGPGRHPD